MNMTTVILAEKPSQARSYVQAFQKSTKKQGYYTASDPVLPENTLVTYGLGHLVELATPDKYDQKYQQWALSNLPIFLINTSLKWQLVKKISLKLSKTY